MPRPEAFVFAEMNLRRYARAALLVLIPATTLKRTAIRTAMLPDDLHTDLDIGPAHMCDPTAEHGKRPFDRQIEQRRNSYG